MFDIAMQFIAIVSVAGLVLNGLGDLLIGTWNRQTNRDL